MMVHFPIAIILLGMLFEAASLYYKKEEWLRKASLYLLVAGALAAVAAFVTGYFLTEEPTGGGIAEVFELHETLAIITLSLIIITAGLRVYGEMKGKNSPVLKRTALVTYALAAVSVAWTGYLGGTMVYEYMTAL